MGLAKRVKINESLSAESINAEIKDINCNLYEILSKNRRRGVHNEKLVQATLLINEVLNGYKDSQEKYK